MYENSTVKSGRTDAWILTGATATGKTSVCQLLAARLHAGIISADSMLVYKGMDIGTAKPTRKERGSAPCYGIDLTTPDQPFSTGAWIRATRNALTKAASDTRQPPHLIVTGGTGLYIKALTSGIDSAPVYPERRAYWNDFLAKNGLPALMNQLEHRMDPALINFPDPSNSRRIIRALEHLDANGKLPDNWGTDQHKPAIITLTMPRHQLHIRIRDRVKQMFEQGLPEEVRNLKSTYSNWSATAAKAIGYQETLAMLDGRLTQADAIERITIRTRQLAKRQETWFRHQQNTIWCEIELSDCIEEIARKVLFLWDKYGKTELKI